MGSRMPLEVHFLSSHSDFFPEKLCEGSDEPGEHYHEDIKSTENHRPVFWNDSVLAEIVP